MVKELTAEQVRHLCAPEDLTCKTSEDMGVSQTIVGQERAVRALHFGLDIKANGFNIFVAGQPGTGRTTAAKRFLEELAKDKPVPPDWCYVNNFRDDYHPKAISLPAGRGNELRKDVKDLVEEANREIRKAFESEQYTTRREDLVTQFQERRNRLFMKLQEEAREQGFLIQATPMGLMTIPLKEDGQPLQDEDFARLTTEQKEEILKKQQELQGRLKGAVREGRGLEKDVNQEVERLDREVALGVLSVMVDELKEKYRDIPAVVSYLDEVQNDMLENLDLFRSQEDQEEIPPQLRMAMAGAQELRFRKYDVNVLVDNSDLKGAPVLIELNPIYNGLFGRVEKEAQFGTLTTDFTLIRQGSLHKANGGYLVIPVEELLRQPWSWDSLKRALSNGEIVIEEVAERMGYLSTKTLKPEPIKLDIKVVLIGQRYVYDLLYAYDEDFRELFKVKADFDSTMDRNKDAVRDYVGFACNVCEEEGLKHLDRSGLMKLVEHGSRLAEDQQKLSVRFGEISDLVREASYYATQDDAQYINGEHIKKAIDERYYRSSLVVDKVREMVQRGFIKIDADGAVPGQVNGLAVFNVGGAMFGQPNRITATVSLGQEGVIDIEREVKLGGPLHSKGVMILSGYVSSKYAQDKPLSMNARLVFEQSYSGVDGDSASSTELYALLSGLSDLPLRQDCAVTGSVNQKGEVQAIGGVNEKIEGFYHVCKLKGLTGSQGVLIPASNQANLMLKEEVVDAVRDGKFHIWPVATIDEGIELLTGKPAGKRKEDGEYEEGTVNYLVNRRLRELSQRMKEFSDERRGKGASGEEDED